MKTIFKEGDRVYFHIYGWGEIFDIDVNVGVKFENLQSSKYFNEEFLKALSFTEYTLEGFSQERPEELPKRGDIVWIKEMDTKMYVPIIFMEAIDDNYVLSFNFMNIKIVNKDFVETKNPYANEQ